MNDDTILKLSVIISLTIIATLGLLLNKLDVSILTGIIGTLSGLGGYYVGKMKRSEEKQTNLFQPFLKHYHFPLSQPVNKNQIINYNQGETMDNQEINGMYIIGALIILGFIVIVVLMKPRETHFIRDSQGNIVSIIER
jgi:hypothetical protein